jgi:methyl halide transferase
MNIGREMNKTENDQTVNGDHNFWDEQYKANTTGWDLGQVSPPLKAYIDQLKDKRLRILIPGGGNSYEAEYLLQKGFTNITVIDIAPTLTQRLKTKFECYSQIKIITGNFFDHDAEYDLILEQTFFCALDPSLRKAYSDKMNKLLAKGAKLAGVLFNRQFENEGPPFGGDELEYKSLFADKFKIHCMEACYNSFVKRQGTELFFILSKQ